MYYIYCRVLVFCAVKFFPYTYLTEQVMQDFWMFRKMYVMQFWLKSDMFVWYFKYRGFTSEFLLKYSKIQIFSHM